MYSSGKVTAALWKLQVRSPSWVCVTLLPAAKMCLTFVLHHEAQQDKPCSSHLFATYFKSFNTVSHPNVGYTVHPAFVCTACSFLSLSLLLLHYCFTHVYLQEGEVNAILQDIAKSRQNILQSLNGVSTVLKMSRRHTPRSGSTVGTNVSVSALKQGDNC